MKDYHNGDGVCKYLNSDSQCSIYETRPDICRVDKQEEIPNMEKACAEACDMLREFVSKHKASRITPPTG